MTWEELKALLVLILVVMVMGFCGWYENQDLDQTAAAPVEQFGVDPALFQARGNIDERTQP